jgi:hypothetical protein
LRRPVSSLTWTRREARVALIGGWFMVVYSSVNLPFLVLMSGLYLRIAPEVVVIGLLCLGLLLPAGLKLMSAGRRRLDQLDPDPSRRDDPQGSGHIL